MDPVIVAEHVELTVNDYVTQALHRIEEYARARGLYLSILFNPVVVAALWSRDDDDHLVPHEQAQAPGIDDAIRKLAGKIS